jgi:hypothetical protein
LGGKIGNINVCAPTCADDVALIAYKPLDIQTMVDIAVDFSKRDGYQLQRLLKVLFFQSNPKLRQLKQIKVSGK